MTSEATAPKSTLLGRLHALIGGAPPAIDAATHEAVALLISGEREARDRSLAIRELNRMLDGDRSALTGLRPHTVSMLYTRAGDRDMMARIETVLAGALDPATLSKLASLRTQMRDWDGALTLYDRLEAESQATVMDRFLAFQIARIDGRSERLEQADIRPLAGLARAFPEVQADLAARHLTLGRPGEFAREVARLNGREAEGRALAGLARALTQRPPGEIGRPGPSHGVRSDWRRIMAVCSLRCSGGAAIQDFIEDHAEVRTSAGEYVALSGYMGLRQAQMAERPRIRAIEFARQHLLGLTVPISRSHSRVLRQARADRAAGRIPASLRAIDDALGTEDTIRGFLHRLLLNVWSNYLDDAPGPLLLKKLFTQGQVDRLGDLPPLRCVMVWRDPRDQYAEQVRRGFCRAGDVEGFITQFETRVAALEVGLAATSPAHRDLFVNVGFESFIQSQAVRDGLRRTLGLNATTYKPERFLPEVSAANIGIWRGECDAADIAVIEARLRPWLDTAAIRLDNSLQ